MNGSSEPRATPRITSWLLLGISAVLCASSFYLLELYGTAHWHIGPCAARLHLDAQEMRQMLKEGVSKDGVDLVAATGAYLDRLDGCLQQFRDASSSIMVSAALYHLTGLLGFLVALGCFLYRPRWVGIIALPPGLASLFMAVVVM